MNLSSNMMKPTAILVNTARGGIVNLDTLDLRLRPEGLDLLASTFTNMNLLQRTWPF